MEHDTMTEMEVQMFLEQQKIMLENQQRMTEDISDIKASVREAAQIVVFMQRDQNELKQRLNIVETSCAQCPARNHYGAITTTSKALLWILTLVATILGIVLYFKK